MNTSKLKNNKFFLGKYNQPNDYRGWFIGSFIKDGHPCKTDDIEVYYKEHQSGDICKPHYHQHKIELLIMIEGEAEFTINDNHFTMKSGDYLFIDVNNVISAKYTKPSKIFAMHSPSIVTDKVKVSE